MTYFFSVISKEFQPTTEKKTATSSPNSKFSCWSQTTQSLFHE